MDNIIIHNNKIKMNTYYIQLGCLYYIVLLFTSPGIELSRVRRSRASSSPAGAGDMSIHRFYLLLVFVSLPSYRYYHRLVDINTYHYLSDTLASHIDLLHETDHLHYAIYLNICNVNFSTCRRNLVPSGTSHDGGDNAHLSRGRE